MRMFHQVLSVLLSVGLLANVVLPFAHSHEHSHEHFHEHSSEKVVSLESEHSAEKCAVCDLAVNCFQQLAISSFSFVNTLEFYSLKHFSENLGVFHFASHFALSRAPPSLF